VKQFWHSYTISKTIFETIRRLGLASFRSKTTHAELFSSIYPPFFASFLHNEPNSFFT